MTSKFVLNVSIFTRESYYHHLEKRTAPFNSATQTSHVIAERVDSLNEVTDALAISLNTYHRRIRDEWFSASKLA